ncbi:MAG: hypothetical protein ABSG13_09575 [Bryobacteraceae bacterium]|jgi:hypothetical protein
MSADKSIEQRILKLQELKRIVADPEMVAMFEWWLAERKNGNANGASSPELPDQRRAHLESATTIQSKSVKPPGDDVEHPLHPLSLPRGSHRRAILDVVNSFSGPVEVATVLAELERIGYPFKAQNRKVMVGSALGKLAQQRKILLVKKGAGSLPHIYKRLEVKD